MNRLLRLCQEHYLQHYSIFIHLLLLSLDWTISYFIISSMILVVQNLPTDNVLYVSHKTIFRIQYINLCRILCSTQCQHRSYSIALILIRSHILITSNHYILLFIILSRWYQYKLIRSDGKPSWDSINTLTLRSPYSPYHSLAENSKKRKLSQVQ